MKRIVGIIVSILFTIPVWSQNTVSWSYSARKIADKTYEVRITATLQNGWHLYSQTQPKDAIAIPTDIRFNRNALLTFKDRIKEVGSMQKKKEPTLGTESWQYAGKVEFVQTIKLKANAKTNVTGSIEFQTCTDEKCLPPKTISFSVMVE